MTSRLRWWRDRSIPPDEGGQAIVIIAFIMIALILFAGLALDAATIYAGQTRLKRAVDAAALAAVVELPNDVTARERSEQFMLANGFDVDDPQRVPLFQTQRIPASGYLQWAITATHRVPLNFLPVINFDHVDVTQGAVAEYRSLVDIYTSQTGGVGILGPVNLAIWGQWSNPRWGDVFSPQCWSCTTDDGATCNEVLTINDAGDVFDCPPGSWGPDVPDGFNPDHTELYNQFGEGYPFRLHIPPGYAEDEVQIEILDPDGYNMPIENVVEITTLGGDPVMVPLNEIDCDPSPGTPATENDQRDACLLANEDGNPYWFMRLDENRCFYTEDEGRPASYNEACNTQTEYRLFYYRQLADKSIVRRNIGSTYIGYADDDDDSAGTDMEWVVAWAVDISCNDGVYLGEECPPGPAQCCDVPDIVEGTDGTRSLRLEVDGVSGYSKNGFDIWAGPPPTSTIPTNVNERNVHLLLEENRGAHDSGGVVTYGSGYLPFTVNHSEPVTLTLAYVPPEAHGVKLNLYHFDNDSGSAAAPQAIDYYLFGVGEWHEVGTLSREGTFSTSDDYVYQPPSNRDHDSLPIPDEFYGAYLQALYQTEFLDSSSWRMEYEGVVGDVFVRLIR